MIQPKEPVSMYYWDRLLISYRPELIQNSQSLTMVSNHVTVPRKAFSVFTELNWSVAITLGFWKTAEQPSGVVCWCSALHNVDSVGCNFTDVNIARTECPKCLQKAAGESCLEIPDATLHSLLCTWQENAPVYFFFKEKSQTNGFSFSLKLFQSPICPFKGSFFSFHHRLDPKKRMIILKFSTWMLTGR